MTTALRQRMLQDLQLAGLSEHTQEAYLRAVRQLAEYFHTPPDRLTEHQLRDYFLHLKNDRKFASGSLVVAYSGIKFFYSHTTPRDWPTLQRLRVRKEKRLPDVLSVDEVRRLIAAVPTPLPYLYSIEGPGAYAASRLTTPSAICVKVASVFFSSCKVASRSLTASLSPSSSAQVFNVP